MAEDPKAETVRGLVEQYFVALDEGCEPTLDELCRGTPELRKHVAYAIAESLRLDDLLAGGEDGPPAPAVGATGRYSDLRPVAAGGMGLLFRATDQEAAREVAYKVLRPELDLPLFRDFFLTEARLTAALAHPAIVPVYGLVTDGCGRPAYAMEFIEGETLHDAIARTVDRRQLLGYFVAVCRAVGFAHAKQITHGDIKANNVRVRTDGKPFVIDWGLARRHPAGIPPAAREADLMALIALLAHILGTTDVPPALKATRDAKYADADRLATAVQQWLDTGGTPDYRDWWTVRAVRWANRRPAVATGIAAGVLLVLLGTIAGIAYRAESKRKRVELASFAREAASNREWARHQEGLMFSIDALRYFGSPLPDMKARAVEKARWACDQFALLADEFPAEPAHRLRLNESRFMLGGFFLHQKELTNGIAEIRAAEEGFTGLSIAAAAGPLPSRLNVRPDALTASNFNRYLWECRLLRASLLLPQGRYHEAFVLIDGVVREQAIAVPPLDRTGDPIVRQLAAMRDAAVTSPSIDLGVQRPPEAILALRDTALMALEMQLSSLPYSRGANPDHARAMREAATLADAARVSDVAVFNTACTFAVASAESGIAPEEKERRAAAAVGYLRRLVAVGYFLNAKSQAELKTTDDDLTVLRNRDDFRAVVAEVERQWAGAGAAGGWLACR